MREIPEKARERSQNPCIPAPTLYGRRALTPFHDRLRYDYLDDWINRDNWLNLELAKKSVQCVEYIAVHEMATSD